MYVQIYILFNKQDVIPAVYLQLNSHCLMISPDEEYFVKVNIITSFRRIKLQKNFAFLLYNLSFAIE